MEKKSTPQSEEAGQKILRSSFGGATRSEGGTDFCADSGARLGFDASLDSGGLRRLRRGVASFPKMPWPTVVNFYR
ncbi:MAG: hypothetical protein U1F66_03915 [bacterium]